MAQALYRMYRPRSLAKVIGQEHITRTLLRTLEAGRISHAYLLTGPRGTGKTSIARILAHAINDLPYSDKTHLDIIEIDAASNRRIDDIRDLRDKVHIAPTSAKYKVYIIDEAHMLTGESFNALLKTLEEPPAHVVFILATTEAHKLPATIISRTQRFGLKPVALDKAAAHLAEIAKKENIAIMPQALELIAEHGDGSLRDSISLLDQMAHIANGDITAEDITHTLGLAPRAQLEALVHALTTGQRAEVATQLEAIEASGANTSALVTQLTKALLQAGPQYPQLYAVIDQLFDVPRAYNPGLKLLSVLMRAAGTDTPSEPQRRTAALAVTPPPVAISIPAKPPAKSANKQTAERQQTPAVIEPNTAPLAALTPAQWHQLLMHLQKNNPPLFSVARQASPIFDATEQTLTLTFKYQLHRKKLDDSKQKAALTAAMHAVLGAVPIIKTDVNKDATPPLLTDDPVVSSVAAIMGGGHIIDATV